MLKSKKPDRLVTLVERNCTNAGNWYKGQLVMPDDHILTLLRREQRAHRARVVKIIAQVKRQASQGRPYCYGIILDTCNDILAALHGRTP